MNPHIASTSHKESIVKDMKNTLETNREIKENQSLAAQKMAADVDENSIAGAHAKTKKLVPERKTKSKQIQKAEKGIFVRKEAADLADSFNERHGNEHYQLSRDALANLVQNLGDKITPDTPAEELIRIVRDELKINAKVPDVAHIDKALEFLVEVIHIKLERATGLNATFLEKLLINVSSTKLKHYEQFKDLIISGHNLIEPAYLLRSTDKSAAETLDHLRVLSDTKNKLDAFQLLKYYEGKGYDFKMIVEEFKKLFSVLGELVKSQPENAHLHQLWEEIRVLQAVLGVFRQADREKRSMEVYLSKVVQIFS